MDEAMVTKFFIILIGGLTLGFVGYSIISGVFGLAEGLRKSAAIPALQAIAQSK